jgi:hypothetical protein
LRSFFQDRGVTLGESALTEEGFAFADGEGDD